MSSTPASTLSVKVTVIREPGVAPMTVRKREVCWDFGIPPREDPYEIVNDLTVTLAPGTIVMLAGPSGSGKTSVLKAIAEKSGDAIRVAPRTTCTKKCVVDLIAPRLPLATVLEILTACGLGEPRLWVRRFSDLSDGEKFRAGLARAIGEALSTQSHPTIFCDEFTAILHRRTAKAIAFNLRKLVTRHALRLVVATTHDDVMEDLRPDQCIRLGGAQPTIESKAPASAPISLQRRVHIVPGTVGDYRAFAPMHYRHRDSLGFVDKVFLLKEGAAGDALGILVFAHAPLELSLRNRVTMGRFVRNVRRLNRELRILRRLVMHPDVRGCGLGHYFVRKALPMTGVRFVEALAAMGTVNPVFEKSGMHRVGQCPLPKGRMKLLERLRAFDIDPFAPEFAEKIGKLPRVRALVESTIADWLSALHSPTKYRIDNKSPLQLASVFRQQLGRPPMYYLWDREGEFPRSSAGDPAQPSHGADRRERERDATRTNRGKLRNRPDAPRMRPGFNGVSRSRSEPGRAPDVR